jgi:hypothetical protein
VRFSISDRLRDVNKLTDVVFMTFVLLVEIFVRIFLLEFFSTFLNSVKSSGGETSSLAMDLPQLGGGKIFSFSAFKIDEQCFFNF